MASSNMTDFQYRCFRDICNLGQYCDEMSERCARCSHDLCEQEPADRIFHQCAYWCNELKKTTISVITHTTDTPALPEFSTHFSLHDGTILALFLLIISILIAILAIIIKLYCRRPDYRHSMESLISDEDGRRGCVKYTPVQQYQELPQPGGETSIPAYHLPPSTRVPVKYPVQINISETSGSRANNIVLHANILGEATGGHGNPTISDQSEV